MKKKITALLLAASMVIMTAGCSLFASGDGEKKDDPKGVKITEEFTHEDPTDVKFDERHVLQIPQGDYFTMTEEQAGVKATDSYIIIYGNEGKPAAYYEYLVCEDEENGNKYKDFMKEAGIKVTLDGNVGMFSKTGDELDAEIAQFISMNMMAEESIEQYVTFFVESYGATELE